MQLEENLLQRVNSLVQSSDLDFWRKGRFLVRTNSQLVSYKAGMCKLVNCAPYKRFVPHLIAELHIWYILVDVKVAILFQELPVYQNRGEHGIPLNWPLCHQLLLLVGRRPPSFLKATIYLFLAHSKFWVVTLVGTTIISPS